MHPRCVGGRAGMEVFILRQAFCYAKIYKLMGVFNLEIKGCNLNKHMVVSISFTIDFQLIFLWSNNFMAVWSEMLSYFGLVWNQFPISQGAKLNNANLKGANLQRAYLCHVNLRDTVCPLAVFSLFF